MHTLVVVRTTYTVRSYESYRRTYSSMHIMHTLVLLLLEYPVCIL